MTDDQYRLYGQLPPDEFLAELESLEYTQEIPAPAGPSLFPVVAPKRTNDGLVLGLTGACVVLLLALLYMCAKAAPLTVRPACAAPTPAEQHGTVMQLDPEIIRGNARAGTWL